MRVIVADTETNGKPLNFNASFKATNNWPRITQFSWVVMDLDTGDYISVHNHIIKPDGWTVPKEQFFIENNMSTERCEAEGIPFAEVASKFIGDIYDLDVLLMVCHNIQFDYNVIASEFIRYGLHSNRKLMQICTMRTTTNLLKLKARYGYKWPKLQELHTYLFGAEFDGNHDAMEDVYATARCFKELFNQGFYKLNHTNER